MKLLKSIFLLGLSVALASAGHGGEIDNGITYYGCPEECDAQREPSCPQYHDDNLPTYFAALSTQLHDKYCGKYVVFMMSDGSNNKVISKATVVDSCGKSCSKYHVDLSKTAFKSVRDPHHGYGYVIWGVYDKHGSQLAGPYYSDVSGVSKGLGMNKDTFISAFKANAKKLASSSHNTASFSASGITPIDEPAKKKTTSKKTTAAPKPVTKPVQNPVQKPVTTNKTLPNKVVSSKVLSTKTLPGQGLSTKSLSATGLPFGSTKTIANPLATKNVTSTVTSKPQEQKNKQVENVVEEKNEESGFPTAGILAIGGGCLGAAGVGLVLLKKKNPSTYEEMKEKFPEAFTTVKRGLTRSATSIKRRVTRKQVATSPAAVSV